MIVPVKVIAYLDHLTAGTGLMANLYFRITFLPVKKNNEIYLSISPCFPRARVNAAIPAGCS